MLSKLILTLSFIGLIGTKSTNNVVPFSTSEGINSGSIKETDPTVRYKGTSNVMSLHSFEFGYVGKEPIQKVNFSYTFKNANFNYRCMFLYTTIDGDTDGYDVDYEKDSYSTDIDYDGCLTIYRNKLPKGNVTFSFKLYAYTKTEEGKIKENATLQFKFYLSVRGTLIRSTLTSIKSYYYATFIENSNKNPTFARYYDELIFNSYSNLKYSDIYFRIKPEKFIYTNNGVLNSQIVKFVIPNNNGSFNDCTDIDSELGRYFLMDINTIGTKKYSLQYKNIRRGGTKNLYLDPFKMHMYSEKKNKYIEVNNIYLSKKNNEFYQKVNVMPVFINFGSNLVNVTMNFTMKFADNYIESYFYTSERVDEVGNDSSGEEIQP